MTFGELKIPTPAPSLGTLAVPAALVPKKVPVIRFAPLVSTMMPKPFVSPSPRKPLITNPLTGVSPEAI